MNPLRIFAEEYPVPAEPDASWHAFRAAWVSLCTQEILRTGVWPNRLVYALLIASRLAVAYLLSVGICTYFASLVISDVPGVSTLSVVWQFVFVGGLLLEGMLFATVPPWFLASHRRDQIVRRMRAFSEAYWRKKAGVHLGFDAYFIEP